MEDVDATEVGEIGSDDIDIVEESLPSSNKVDPQPVF